MAKSGKSYGGVFLLLILFIIAVIVTLTTPVFNITKVTVTGNARIPTEEILSAANIPIGMNTYRVSMRKAEKRLEALPYVDTAKIRRRFPARIRIEITEREEAAAIECPGGYAIVDATCRVLRVSGEEADILKADGTEVTEARPGTIIRTKNDRFPEDLKTILDALTKEKIKDEMTRITIRSAVEVALETKGGLEIHLGGMDELPYKIQLCQHILLGGHAGINKDSAGILQWTKEGQFSYRQNKN